MFILHAAVYQHATQAQRMNLRLYSLIMYSIHSTYMKQIKA